MRLVRNVKLFFREGNSDKTYEVDLCETGPDLYLVNFRYGKRNGPLKEGTKTVAPVSLAAATALFDALEKEKRNKGYMGEQESVQDLSFVPADLSAITHPAHRAILQRLQDAISNTNTYKTHRRISRVIWKAGQYKLAAAVPYIIKLVDRGNAMQRYASLWALGRCGDAGAVPVLRAYFENSSYPYNLRMLAANALLLVLPEAEKAQHIQYFVQGLPEPFQAAIQSGNAMAILQLLRERVQLQLQPQYPLLEELYVVSAASVPVKQALVTLLPELPLRPSYFQHLRHIFKQAELREDLQIVAILAGRFDREAAMFNISNRGYEDYIPSVYVPELAQALKAEKELKKSNSRIAFSNLTKGYLRRRTVRTLREYGEQENIMYVRLATALLLQYDEARDGREAYQTQQYQYVNGRYQVVHHQHPAHEHCVYLHYILQGNAPNIKLDKSGSRWYFTSTQPEAGKTVAPAAEQPKSLIGRLFSWVSQDKHKSGNTPPPAVASTEVPVSKVPFLHLWQQLPMAFLQLLVSARMNDIHLFAMEQLKAHPEYTTLKQKMDVPAIRGLLSSIFHIPQHFGLELAQEHYNPAQPSLPLLLALVNSPLDIARETGMQYIRQHLPLCFGDADFVIQVVFSAWNNVRAFAGAEMGNVSLSPEQAQVLCGKAISWMLTLQGVTSYGNDALNEGCGILEQYYGNALRNISTTIIDDLLQSPIPAAHALAARLLLLKQDNFDYDTLPDELLERLLHNEYAPVRAAGIAILNGMRGGSLINRPELLLQACLSAYSDTRLQTGVLAGQLSQSDRRLGVWLANELVPRLMRKETAEGLHQDIGQILRNDLVDYLQDVDTATALRLVYSNYRPAQEFGVVVLDRYIPAAALTLRQVIAAGSHELLAVRQWCWRFYEQQLARIRYERDAAIGILDAKWNDTRDFAKDFFRAQFSDQDWTPETLVAIADSVRPDIQAFGRELLVKFFRTADGPSYLLQLSQHPSVTMQLFATGYLAGYATDNLAYMHQLEHYFRSVLSRVNKARAAKERIFAFLQQEALRTPEAAAYVSEIITAVSATVSIGDKATCITIMRDIHTRYPDIPLPIKVVTY